MSQEENLLSTEEAKSKSDALSVNNNKDEKAKPGLGRRLARFATGVGMLGLGAAGAAMKAMTGDFEPAAKLAQGLVMPFIRGAEAISSFKEAKNKIVEKLNKTKIGRGLVKFTGAIWNTLTSKPAKRIYKVGVAAITLAASATPPGAAIAALSLAAVAYNVTKESLDVKKTKALERERSHLLEYQSSINLQEKLLTKAKSLGERSALYSFLQQKADLNKPTNSSIEKKEEEVRPVSKFKETLKTIRDNAIEGAAVVMECLEGDAVEQAMAAVTIAGGIARETDEKINNKQIQNNLKKDIQELKPKVPAYQNRQEIKEYARKLRVQNEVMMRLMKTPGIQNMSQEEIQMHHDTVSSIVNNEKEFKPVKRSLWQRFTNSIKSAFKHVKDSQFGEITGSIYANPEKLEEKIKNDKEAIEQNHNEKFKQFEESIKNSLPDHATDHFSHIAEAEELQHIVATEERLHDSRTPQETTVSQAHGKSSGRGR